MNNTHIRSGQTGFTLIELVVVIVLLGILGVTALGKFQDLSQEAADAAEQGVASELSSAAAINYASSVVGTGTAQTISTIDCSDGSGGPSAVLDSLMASGSAPSSGYTYADNASEGAACTAGQTYLCSVQNDSGDNAVNATATIICTGP